MVVFLPLKNLICILNFSILIYVIDIALLQDTHPERHIKNA